MGQKVVVALAEGFEEIEAVAVVDVMRRAGLKVDIAGIGGEYIEGANAMVLKSDLDIATVLADDYDMIVLPGGFGGTDVLANDERVQTLLKAMNVEGKLIGAICAAPLALQKAGILEGDFTCYPSVEQNIQNSNYTDAKAVVISGNVITSRGPGTAICFGLEIVKKLCGVETYEQLREGLLATYC